MEKGRRGWVFVSTGHENRRSRRATAAAVHHLYGLLYRQAGCRAEKQQSGGRAAPLSGDKTKPGRRDWRPGFSYFQRLLWDSYPVPTAQYTNRYRSACVWLTGITSSRTLSPVRSRRNRSASAALVLYGSRTSTRWLYPVLTSNCPREVSM